MKTISSVIAVVLLSLTTTAFAQSGGTIVSGDGTPVTSSDGSAVEWTGKGTSSAGSN